MFTIQYTATNGESKMQELDTNNRRKLLLHLALFTHPILAVYEQASPVTKMMRKELAEWPGTKTRYAVDFANSLQ